ncbi:hypothetical protein LWI29_014825 [Acer saccharum]|uniref:Homeobox domain-containing protein n=1 Tax=Acer saccharum TaxID=4024 RepID=A0AA39TAA1_ACESA|nr:hypothetical protein LWI29_014825 [Acer saccharum]KAK1587085.1 hypothetical protein Q3G72_009352 [Acer saccharum]
MEDSNEMRLEENKLLSEKNVKRRFKTPAQVMALENFYNEHKYPTEELKQQLAEQIGLTEKQVSGWFCHRRLKEKRLSTEEAFATGRQDRSSGIVQDHGSGLRQDSCCSTKQGNHKNVDAREVESRRLYGHGYPVADLAGDHRTQFTGHVSVLDDTSSESSSYLQDRFYSQNKDPLIVETSRFTREDNGAIVPTNPNKTKNKEYKPSGYLKVKGETENAAITAVKRQLGRQYREDGPPLGTEFEPLPPGSFESASSNPMNEPSYVGNSKWPHSPDLPGVQKQRALGTRREVHSSNTDLNDLYAEEENRIMHGSDYQGTKSHKQMKQKPPRLSYSNPSPAQNSYPDMHEDYNGETPVTASYYDSRLKSKHDAEETRLESNLNHHDLYGGKITSEKTKLLLHDYDNVSPSIVQHSEYLSKPSYITPGSNKSLDAEERGRSKKMKKVEKLHKEKKVLKGQRDPLRVMTHPANKMTVAKRVRPEFPLRDYMAEPSYADIPPRTNPKKGSAGDMPCSFSEDETAETSSS